MAKESRVVYSSVGWGIILDLRLQSSVVEELSFINRRSVIRRSNRNTAYAETRLTKYQRLSGNQSEISRGKLKGSHHNSLLWLEACWPPLKGAVVRFTLRKPFHCVDTDSPLTVTYKLYMSVQPKKNRKRDLGIVHISLYISKTVLHLSDVTTQNITLVFISNYTINIIVLKVEIKILENVFFWDKRQQHLILHESAKDGEFSVSNWSDSYPISCLVFEIIDLYLQESKGEWSANICFWTGCSGTIVLVSDNHDLESHSI